jgi:hypothetical protein
MRVYMRPRLQRRIAAIIIACFVASMFAGCSKPIDSQSSVPAVYQPLVFIAVAVGAGILIASHSHKSKGGGGGGPPPPNLTPAIFVGSFSGPANYSPTDITIDFSSAGAGGIGSVGTSAGATYSFAEMGSIGPNNGSYTLPSSYKPIAVAIDGNGNDWFTDAGGLVKRCPPPAVGVTTCVPALSFSDGLPASGTRTVAADSGRFFIAEDNLSGTVTWAAYALDGTGRVTGTYNYNPGLGMYSGDAAMAILLSTGLYTIFHKDGTSWKVAIPNASRNAWTFSPVPLPNGNVATDGSGINYGLLGSPVSGSYQIAHYASPPSSSGAPGALVSTITIAFNGATSGNAFRPPVSSLHFDGVNIFMLDASGNLVLFSAF